MAMQAFVPICHFPRNYASPWSKEQKKKKKQNKKKQKTKNKNKKNKKKICKNIASLIRC